MPASSSSSFFSCRCCYKAPRSPSHLSLTAAANRGRTFLPCRVASCYSLQLSWSPWFSLSHPFGASRFCCWPSLIARVRSSYLQEFSAANDMNLEAVAASKSGSSSSSTVAFSWEHEPGVSKQSHFGANKPSAAGGAPRAEAVSRRTPASAKNKQAPAPAPAAAATTHRHRLRVPPPPGVPGAPAPAASPPRRRTPRSRGVVRPAEDPFLAAYLACTEDGASGGRDDRGAQKLLGWAGLRVGLGLGLRGRGLSCKSSCGAVEECVVRLAKIPGLHED